MKKAARMIGPPAACLLFLLWAVASAASASDLGPRPRRTIPMAEPAAIALLGAGLVSLGLYAKKKRGKKQ